MNLIEKITKSQIRTDIPEFRVGDTVVVGVKIVERGKERVQDFEGIVTAIKNRGIGRNFVVRKTSGGVGVERTFPINSPKVAGVTVVRRGKVRRAKLNFLKNLQGTYRIKERGQK